MTAFWAPGSAIALLVAGAFFMENLDGTVVVTAMPQMGVSFGVHAVDLNAGISVYMLTLAMLIPASGWIADRFGARLVFAAAIAIFTVASIVCGLCQNFTMFTFARIFQGVGDAMMVPVGRLVILRSTPKHELMRAIATITWPGLAAPMLGPPLGGFITTYASWRWIFFLNVPLGLCALALALRLIPEAGERKGSPSIISVSFSRASPVLRSCTVSTSLVATRRAGGSRLSASSADSASARSRRCTPSARRIRWSISGRSGCAAMR